MFLLVRSSSLGIIFPHLFLSQNIFLVPFPLQTLFPRLFYRDIFFSIPFIFRVHHLSEPLRHIGTMHRHVG